MNKDSSDFMLQEYSQIASAFFHLQDKINEWFKTYIALYGVPFTVLAAVIAIGGPLDSTNLFGLPDIVAFLLLVIALLGLFIAMMMVSIRMEMILYARTINNVRRYFAANDADDRKNGNSAISEFLVLPTSDGKPPFYEPWRSVFWQVLFIGFLDSLTIYISSANLLSPYLCELLVAALLYWFVHWLAYWMVARRREMRWKELHSEDLNLANY